jgi:hypothetical protein
VMDQRRSEEQKFLCGPLSIFVAGNTIHICDQRDDMTADPTYVTAYCPIDTFFQTVKHQYYNCRSSSRTAKVLEQGRT